MSSLKQHQEALLKLIATPKPMAMVLEENPGLDHRIANSSKCTTAEGVEIYSTAYYQRILETMKQNYPKLLEEMGEENFATLTGDYLLAHQPYHYSLNQVDEHFASFIREPVLANIALFEKTELECFFSKDSESLTLQELEQTPQDQWMELEFKLIPSCRLVEFDREDDRFILFFRPELDVHYRSIDAIQVQLLHQLQSSPRFDLLCEKAAELSSAEEAVSLVGSYLMTWLDDGILAKL